MRGIGIENGVDLTPTVSNNSPPVADLVSRVFSYNSIFGVHTTVISQSCKQAPVAPWVVLVQWYTGKCVHLPLGGCSQPRKPLLCGLPDGTSSFVPSLRHRPTAARPMRVSCQSSLA